MAMATCWNCGARVSGPKCQMCGAAQQAGGAEGPPAYAPGGQPVVSQASMSVRSPQPTPGNDYASGGQYPYPPTGQSGGWQGQPSMPNQGGWQGQPSMPNQGGWQGYPQQPGFQQPGYPPQGYQQPGYSPQGSQPPSAYQQQQAYRGAQPAAPVARPAAAALNLVALLLGLAGGAVGGIVGGILWAAILNFTNYNVYYLAILIGILAGGGVALGARGQNRIVLAILAAAVGLLTFFFALYLRVSYWEHLGFTGMPIGDFTQDMSDYLQTNPLNYIFFVAVPLLAALTAFRGFSQRRVVRRR